MFANKGDINYKPISYFSPIEDADKIKNIAIKEKVSPIQVLESDRIRIINKSIGNAFLHENSSWLDDPKLVAKATSSLLYDTLVENERFYEHPHLLEKLDSSDICNFLVHSNIDFKKIPNLQLVLKKLSLQDATFLIKELLLVQTSRSFYLLELLLESNIPANIAFQREFLAFISMNPCITIFEFLKSLEISTLKKFVDKSDVINHILKQATYHDLIILLTYTFVSHFSFSSLNALVLGFKNLDPTCSFFDSLHPIFVTWFKSCLAKRDLLQFVWVPEVYKRKLLTALTGPIPEELQNVILDGELNHHFVYENNNLMSYYKQMDIELILPYVELEDENHQKYNLSSVLSHIFGKEDFDDIVPYGFYLFKFRKEFMENKFNAISINTSKEEALNLLDDFIFHNIAKEGKTIGVGVPEHFKNRYPSLFLPANVPEELWHKYYSRDLTPQDFQEHPDWYTYFDNTEIAFGLSLNVTDIYFADIKVDDYFSSIKDKNDFFLHLAQVFVIATPACVEHIIKSMVRLELAKSGVVDFDILMLKAKLINIASRCDYDFNVILKDQIFNTILEMPLTNEELEKGNVLLDIVSKIVFSNSKEIENHAPYLLKKILKSNNPLDTLTQLEEIFLSPNVPDLASVFITFSFLFPTLSDEEFNQHTISSPVLKSASPFKRKIIIFSDLVKAMLGSNNRSINQFLEILEKGNTLYTCMLEQKIAVNSLNAEDSQLLNAFCSLLTLLYNNTLLGKKNMFKRSDDILSDLNHLKRLFSFNGTMNYYLPDRIVKMFCHFAGFDTLDSVKDYIARKINEADIKNRGTSLNNLIVEEGDFIKGLNETKHLPYIMQNGVLAADFLGADAKSDTTPLDTDLSMVLKPPKSLQNVIYSSEASTYGPIFAVLKNNRRLSITKNHLNNGIIPAEKGALEVFQTDHNSFGHYGIRTGFAISDIDAFITKYDNPFVGLEIALKGFYIPVYNMNGELIFTPEDYAKIRKKMQGISFYGQADYQPSNHLTFEGISSIKEGIEANAIETNKVKSVILQKVSSVVESFGYTFLSAFSKELHPGLIEFVDIGSTGRFTNLVNDADFDFSMRLDTSLLKDTEKLAQFKGALLQAFNKSDSKEITDDGHFRLKKVLIDGKLIDIDITFVNRTNKLGLPSCNAVYEQLNAIQNIDEDTYLSVLANILKAKQILKENGAYKTKRAGDCPQGGLGGIGIENWILQHGGSFYDAAVDFLIVADTCKDFDEFQEKYHIWNFGENILALYRGKYIRENYVDYMDRYGFEKMKKALRSFIDEQTISHEEHLKLQRTNQKTSVNN